MGTRSLTFVYDENNRSKNICMYRQFDGYPEGHGKELADFLLSKKLVNGIGRDPVDVANGMGCLSALMVSHFKKEAGNFYIYPTRTKDVGEEFEYHVYKNRVKVYAIPYSEPKKLLFNGNWADFKTFCKNGEQE